METGVIANSIREIVLVRYPINELPWLSITPRTPWILY